LIILSALLMTLPLSYPGLYYLSWIALVPFLFSIKNDAPVQGFKKGFLLGYIMFISISFWLYFPLVNFSGLPWIICLLLLAIAFIIPGFFYGLWAWTYILLFIYYYLRRNPVVLFFLLLAGQVWNTSATGFYLLSLLGLPDILRGVFPPCFN